MAQGGLQGNSSENLKTVGQILRDLAPSASEEDRERRRSREPRQLSGVCTSEKQQSKMHLHLPSTAALRSFCTVTTCSVVVALQLGLRPLGADSPFTGITHKLTSSHAHLKPSAERRPFNSIAPRLALQQGRRGMLSLLYGQTGQEFVHMRGGGPPRLSPMQLQQYKVTSCFYD